MHLPDKESLKERFRQYSDEQLMEILKNRAHYQEQAAEAATEAALERNLINSREDLLSPEFRQHSLPKRRFFPRLDEQQSARTIRSLYRIVYLITVIPAIFSVMSYLDRDFLRLGLWVVAAGAWAVTALLMTKRRNGQFIWLLAAIFFGFHIIWLTSVRSSIKPGATDFLIYALSLCLFLYIMGYLYVLLGRSKKTGATL